MDKLVSQNNNGLKRNLRKVVVEKPTRKQAEKAVRTLIAWAGDNPHREGLIDTPKRVVDAYEEFFSGYQEDPVSILSRCFDDVEGYDDLVLLRDISIETHCEHHMIPIIGKAHIAYFPRNRVVGLSKLARVVDVFAKRLQTQETMTAQIAQTIQTILDPKGVAVMIDAKHQCMTTRGTKKPNTSTVTTQFTGVFADDSRMEDRFYKLINTSK